MSYGPGLFAPLAATDDKGATATSTDITITVRTQEALPPTVVLAVPTNHSVFQEADSVVMTTAVTQGSNPIQKAEF